jgi:hypothetical protein
MTYAKPTTVLLPDWQGRLRPEASRNGHRGPHQSSLETSTLGHSGTSVVRGAVNQCLAVVMGRSGSQPHAKGAELVKSWGCLLAWCLIAIGIVRVAFWFFVKV